MPKPEKDEYETWHVENRQDQGVDGKEVHGRKLFGKEVDEEQEMKHSITGPS